MVREEKNPVPGRVYATGPKPKGKTTGGLKAGPKTSKPVKAKQAKMKPAGGKAGRGSQSAPKQAKMGNPRKPSDLDKLPPIGNGGPPNGTRGPHPAPGPKKMPHMGGSPSGAHKPAGGSPGVPKTPMHPGPTGTHRPGSGPRISLPFDAPNRPTPGVDTFHALKRPSHLPSTVEDPNGSTRGERVFLAGASKYGKRP